MRVTGNESEGENGREGGLTLGPVRVEGHPRPRRDGRRLGGSGRGHEMRVAGGVRGGHHVAARAVGRVRLELRAVAGVHVRAEPDAEPDAEREPQAERLAHRPAAARAGRRRPGAVRRRDRAGHVRLPHGGQVRQARHAAALRAQVHGHGGVRVRALVARAAHQRLLVRHRGAPVEARRGRGRVVVLQEARARHGQRHGQRARARVHPRRRPLVRPRLARLAQGEHLAHRLRAGRSWKRETLQVARLWDRSIAMDSPNLGPALRPSLVALVELVVLAVDSVGLGCRLRTWFTALSTDAPVARLSEPPPVEPPEAALPEADGPDDETLPPAGGSASFDMWRSWSSSVMTRMLAK